MQVTLDIRKLIAQKDKLAKESGVPFMEHEFMNGPEDEAEILFFKRIIVRGHLEVATWAGPFELILSLRGNIVTVRPHPECPLNAVGIWYAIVTAVQSYYLGDGRAIEPAKWGRDFEVGFCTTPSAARLADVLHHMRDQGRAHVNIAGSFPPEYVERNFLRPMPREEAT